MRKIIRKTILKIMITGLFISQTPYAPAALGDTSEVEIMTKNLQVYTEPEEGARANFILYEGMRIKPEEIMTKNGESWTEFSAGNQNYWVKWMEGGGKTMKTIQKNKKTTIVDSYGILEMPHRYAVKLVKLKGAKGRLETYRKKSDEYIFQYEYDVTYPEEGPKSKYGDMKTVGGNIVRYIYRTAKSGMNGRDQFGEPFGVYKISYPMPHDALPYFLEGKMGTSGYNNIPTIRTQNGRLIPHPHSLMGADILIHTAQKGSRGCINVDNEAMSFLYHNDLNALNEREIIPLVIYDEDVEAPPMGNLF